MTDPIDLSYTRFGGDNGTPLIILHGFFASSRNWRPVAEKLAAQYPVYVPDLRNHGASPHHPVMDYPAMSADLLHFINRHRLPAVNLLGHSMGGKVAMWFALHYPERLNKLVVADIAPVCYPHRFDELIAALAALPLAELTNRKQAEALLADAIPDLSYRQFLLQNLVLEQARYRWRINLDIFRRNAALIAGFPAPSPGRICRTDTLFVAGADSHYLNADQLAALFPDAAVSVIADAGHWLHVQQPAAFVARVTRFLGAIT